MQQCFTKFGDVPKSSIYSWKGYLFCSAGFKDKSQAVSRKQDFFYPGKEIKAPELQHHGETLRPIHLMLSCFYSPPIVVVFLRLFFIFILEVFYVVYFYFRGDRSQFEWHSAQICLVNEQTNNSGLSLVARLSYNCRMLQFISFKK